MKNALVGLHVLLVFGMLASVVFWMPFGIGYYGWPWQRLGWRVALYLFVFALPVGATVGCIAAFHRGFSLRQFILPFLALLVGLFGLFALLSWRE